MDSLRQLAHHLAVPERTLRRMAAEGLIHGERLSERRFRTTLREEEYLRRHWSLLSDLRSALRTEPTVRLAVLFGSFARGDDRPASDVDVAVSMDHDSLGRLADLSGRLSRRLERDVQLVRLDDARTAPALMRAIADDGRVLVDRNGLWPAALSEVRHMRSPDVSLLDHLPEPWPGSART